MVHLKKRRFLFFVFALIFLLFLGGIVFYFFFLKPSPKVEYQETFRLVPEKVSQSAPIRISLPPGIDKDFAKRNLKFYPEIKGKWVEDRRFFSFFNKFFSAFATSQVNYLLFQPDQPLKLNRYYRAELTLQDGGTIKADFLVVENPKIIAVFPKEKSEAPEDTEITIVFNRPMVPLTTLGELEAKNIPIEIYPKTEGKFKWITTRNLQFIPKDRLRRSSNYTVKIKPGLVSVEGLKVEGKEFHFVTRKLRYLDITSGELKFNQPIVIYFNQPVDLERTKQAITLIDNSTGAKIPFIAEYGGAEEERTSEQSLGLFNFRSLLGDISQTFTFFDWFGKKEKKGREKSIIKIYNRQDKFGRKKLWDFGKSYTLKIERAFPLEGDIILNEKREVTIFILPIIKAMRAESDRTFLVDLDLFDPQGRLKVEFYEEIDLSKSKITAYGLKKIEYGEKCKEGEISSFATCEKVPDKSTIYLYFEPSKLSPNQSIQIKFEKLVNSSGLVIQRKPIFRSIKVYPPLKILRTSPSNGDSFADLRELVICSTTPLKAPPKEEQENYFFSNLDYELDYWGSSWRVKYTPLKEVCRVGEFKTTIHYGLMPEKNYTLRLILEDVFGQREEISLSFRTQKMPQKYLNFYHLQRTYAVTTPQKTKLSYAVENMEYINVDICKLKADNFLYWLKNSPKITDPPEKITNCKKRVKETIQLKKKYWVKNYFQVDLRDYFENPIGHYILTFYHPEYTYSIWRRGEKITQLAYERTYITVTNLGVAEKKILPEVIGRPDIALLSEKEMKQLKNLYWVTNLSSLEPVENAKISLFDENLALKGTYYTNKEGITLTKVIPKLEGVIVQKGKDSTILFSSTSQLNWGSYVYMSKRVYLYTDKPIYRPGQKVYIKGIYRIGFDGNWQIIPGQKVNLKVYNSKNDEILNKELEVNEFGTFNTEFVLEDKAPLGNYRVCVYYNCTYFDVEEYVPAPFEVKVLTDKDEYISKDKIKIDIEANYYFGVPLEGGEVTYTVTSQNYYFDKYKDEYLHFGKEINYWRGYPYGDKFLFRGKLSLSENGKTSFTKVLDIDKLFTNEDERRSKIIVVDVTVKDSQGRSVSAQKSFILHRGEYYIGLKLNKYFLEKGQPTQIKVKTVDSEGKPKKVNNLTLSIYKINWVWEKRQEAGGGYGYKWEKKKELVSEYKFSTDREGNYLKEIQFDKEGEYEITVQGKDKRNNLIQSTYSIYVCGAGSVAVPPTTDTRLQIEVKKRTLNVGKTGEVVIKSPYKEAKALITLERGKVFDYQIVDIKGNLFKYQFQVKDEYIPNIFLSALLQSTKPEVKFGSVEFQIDTKKKELKIETKTNKQFYLPGEEVTLDIQVRDFHNNPVETEVSVAVVDVSVLALKGNPKKNPVVFFYGGFPLGVITSSNLKNILIETKIPTKGGGARAPEAELAKKARGEFRETAYFNAQVRTDKSGKAKVKFTLPDNLTTWQTEVLGVTKDTKLGVNYSKFITKKDLMVVPLKPRFVVPGDQFYIGAKIFNQTNRRQQIELEFKSSTLILKEKTNKKSVSIDAGKTDTLYFFVEAPKLMEKGEHKFTLSAKGSGVEDTVIQYIKITPDDTFEAVATANYTQDNLSREYVFLPDNILKSKGEVKISASATLAVFLSDALNYLIKYPYGCSEQIASKLNALAIVKQGLNLPNLQDKFQLEKVRYSGKEYTIEEIVDIGLTKLYNQQRADGGFGFWDYGRSNFYLTLHVIEALENLKLAGFNVNEAVIEKAKEYVKNHFSTQIVLYKDKSAMILAAYTLFKNQKTVDDPLIKNFIQEIARDDTYIYEYASNASLAQLAILLTKGFDLQLQEKIYNLLQNRIDIDARGAFIEPKKGHIFVDYYENPIKDTALYLKALSVAKKRDPIIDKVIRWLLNSKSKDGSWGSTNNTLTVIEAFVEYLKWQRETESNFILELFVNQKSEGKYHFEPSTILDQFKKEIPLGEFKFGEINVIEFRKENLNQLPNNLYYDMILRYYLPAQKIPPRDEGFTIQRTLHRLQDKENKEPVNEARVGDILRVHLQITVPKTRRYVLIEDFIPAGFEIVNLDLATEQKSLRLQEKEIKGREFIPDFKELRDDRAVLFKEYLSPGVYEFDYFVRALIKGKFIHLPARVSEMYSPENFGRTPGGYFEIK